MGPGRARLLGRALRAHARGAFVVSVVCGLAMAVLLSCVFSVPPLFFGLADPERMREGIGRAGVFAAVLAWYLLPIGIVSYGGAGWPLVAVFALQPALAGRGSRVWTLVGHGATCAPILAYVVASEAARVPDACALSPYSAAAALLQSLVLAGIEFAIRSRDPGLLTSR